MSFDLFINGRPQGQIASMHGKEVLNQELESRSPNPESELAKFLLRGWTDAPQVFGEEIKAIMNDLTEDSRDVLRAILKLLPEKGTVSVSAE